MNIAVVGHVDHGKSTIVGRLLADTGTLPQGKLDQVRAACERNARPFEYAFLIDALKEEQGQGITIESARVFFRTPRRPYIIIDAPGHLEFLRNMVTGAARAEAALLVVDAREGMQGNTRRHGSLLPLLGVRHIAVLINKIDLIDRDPAACHALEGALREFLTRNGATVSACIPVSGRDGDNLITPSPATPWYRGPTLVQFLDALEAEPPPIAQPFRMPVQGVYKFTADGDERRIVAGEVTAGTVSAGDAIVFYPSGKRSRVQSLERFSGARPVEASAGEAAGFTLTEQIYVSRGEVACRADEMPPVIAVRMRASIFWLGTTPLLRDQPYRLKLGTTSVRMVLESIERRVDADALETPEEFDGVRRHEVAECVLRLDRPVAVDPHLPIAAGRRFVIVDAWEIRGGGIIRDVLPDAQQEVRTQILVRNTKWESSSIASEQRSARLGQQPALVLITGPRAADRKTLARALEARLFEAGRLVYFLGIGNLLYGVDADLERTGEHRAEHLRRLGEVAHILLDAGVILIVTAADIVDEELDLIRNALDYGRVHTMWLGDPLATATATDLELDAEQPMEEHLRDMLALLRDRHVVPVA